MPNLITSTAGLTRRSVLSTSVAAGAAEMIFAMGVPLRAFVDTPDLKL